MFKKLTSGLVSVALIAASAAAYAPASVMSTSAADQPDYAEALQKSLYFYECQQAGPLPEWNRVEWRADSTMIDEIKGGWYDAGDHVKFNLPMAYSASMLAWGLYQYPDGVEASGEMTNYVNNLEFVLDYFVDCDLGDEIVYQVGIGQIDHTWWGPVELYEYAMVDNGTTYESAREALKSSEGCCAVFGEMAAALASGAVALDGRISSSKISDYLAHAEHIFEAADASKSDDVYNGSDAQGFYPSSHFYDQLFYAANWLYIATGEQSYLDKAKSYIPNLSKMLGEGDTLAYGWCHCWDDNMQGAMLLYAINTNDSTYIAHVKKHLDRWVSGDEAKTLPGGFRWLTTWGCLRYAETAAFLAAVASDTIFAGTDTSSYEQFYETQINYALGDNPDNFSYVVGYGDNCPHNPHHRTAHASWKNAEAYPVMSRHTLYGALVGGPSEDGTYEDDRSNYINNEVATDYNAGYTAMLCKMIDKYGGTSDPSFPPVEQHDGPEFYVETKMGQTSASGVSLSFKITNHSAWPARVQDNLSFRYYMDLSEVISAGYSPSDMTIRCDRDQASSMYAGRGYAGAEISDPIQYKDNIYYVEVTLPDGRAVLPVSEGMHQCEIMLAFVFPNYQSGWDATNDFSNHDLLDGGSTTDEDGKEIGIVSPYIPVYINGELYYGYEPDGTYADGGMTVSDKPITTTTTTTTTTTASTVGEDILYGDANCNKTVEMADSVLILQSQANPDKYGIGGSDKDCLSALGAKNADCSGSGDGITAKDALAVQKYLLKIITLPEE